MVHYFLFDVTHVNYSFALSECYKKCKASMPNNTMSIRYNNDQTQSIVKCICDVPPTFGAELLETFTPVTHAQLESRIYTDVTWQDSTKTDVQKSAITTRLKADRTALSLVAV